MYKVDAVLFILISDIERKVVCRFLINQITVLIKVDKIEEEEVGFKT